MIRLFLKIVFVTLILATVFLYFGNDLLVRLEAGTRLPSSGPNFETYSRVLSTVGRTHVHEKLKPVLLDSYKRLEKTEPNITWIFGESGWKNGGPFWPHRTHQNGLSVDFMVPVLERGTKTPTKLALSPFNLWGYSLRFDNEGLHGDVQIDFAAIISHLRALNDACDAVGLRIKRVIFEPKLLAKLRAERHFGEIRNILFMENKAWFPHDSHYHVDFGS